MTATYEARLREEDSHCAIKAGESAMLMLIRKAHRSNNNSKQECEQGGAVLMKNARDLPSFAPKQRINDYASHSVPPTPLELANL